LDYRPKFLLALISTVNKSDWSSWQKSINQL
jgi:hypothetical protein